MSSSIKVDAFCPVGIGGTKHLNTRQLKLFIGGLSPQETSRDLYDLFCSYGTIREAVVIPDRFRVRSRCYGFVEYLHSHSIISIPFPIIHSTNRSKVALSYLSTKKGHIQRRRLSAKSAE